MKKLIILILLIISPSFLHAASCEEYSAGQWYPGSYESQSLALADAQACLADANWTNGDTINLKAGEVTWADDLVFTASKYGTLKGAGATSTVITTETATSITLTESPTRITAIGFIMTGAGTGQINIAGGSGWRIDHCKFTNSYGSSRVTIWVNGTNVTSTPAGLIDNNDFVEARIIINRASNWAEANTLWGTAHLFGSDDNGYGSVYIEDNTFYKTVSAGGNVIDAEDAQVGAFVARYNAVTGNTSFMAHPQSGATQRGTRAWEIYGNTFAATSASTYTPMNMRSGTGFIFGNTISNYSVNGTVFDIWRVYTAVAGTSATGYCDGGEGSYGQWDGSSANGWPCRDQIGRGTDEWIWTDGEPYPPQESKPVYLWSNRVGASEGTVAIANGADNWILANRDYYNGTDSFNGTGGVGCGTLASRPATCTTGVGYWATDQSCSDLTGLVGVSPATPISGTLYKCTATNTWTTYYTPYAYPHPLRGETSNQTLTLTIGGSGSCTVTSFPAGISSTSSTTYDFVQNTEVTLTVTATLPNYLSAWSGTGGCTGTGSCVMTMSAAKAATATCSRYGTATIGSGGSMTIGSGGSLTLQ